STFLDLIQPSAHLKRDEWRKQHRNGAHPITCGHRGLPPLWVAGVLQRTLRVARRNAGVRRGDPWRRRAVQPSRVPMAKQSTYCLAGCLMSYTKWLDMSVIISHYDMRSEYVGSSLEALVR